MLPKFDMREQEDGYLFTCSTPGESPPSSEREFFTDAASEREGNNLKGCGGCPPEAGSSQGRNLALTVLFVPNSLCSGPADPNPLRHLSLGCGCLAA